MSEIIEYDYKKFNGTCINSAITLVSLNELGKDGWIIIGATMIESGSGFSALFYRIKP